MKKYTKEHQWIEITDGIATVGITEYAAHELNELTYVELPAVGKIVESGAQLCVVESVKAASDVFMPVGGQITEVNSKLEDSPELVSDDPEGEGWICRATGVNAAAVDALMDNDAYIAYVKSIF